MSLANCKHCGQLHLKVKSDYCGTCQELYDECYRKVRDFLKANAGSTLWDIHQKLNIPVPVLQKILRDDFVPFNT